MKKIVLNILLIALIGIVWINISASGTDMESRDKTISDVGITFNKIHPSKVEIDSVLLMNPFAEIVNNDHKPGRKITLHSSVQIPEEAATISFSGLIRSPDNLIFILSVNGEPSRYLQAGDTINRYKIIRCNNDSLQLKSIQTNETRFIGLQGK